jgi:hypothetical protein
VPVTTIPSFGVMAFFAWMALKVKVVAMSPIPWWVGPYTHLVGPYLDGGSQYWSSPPDGAVLSMQRGAGIASVRTKRIAVPSVLAD